ncbi:hypothetical protein A6A04_05280 [Paramagnetospirillum marisnigri]|uniref:Flagellin n=1 Tax=Paramagnetospirillum marisnigri TaxID=1285242 RepID=A0A178MJH6_9PROT|nr:flagellin [Paramagnetospirillum marisnigri]OAN48164.1 hypothetical protein A6A04_05280 [Paramagnetospirillum marisnigri]
MADVTLSATIRNNLLSLQNTGDLVARTNTRLSTGKNVSSAIDDAVAFFQDKSLKDRAGDMSTRKSEIDQGISNLSTALNAVTKVENLMVQMKGIVLSAKSASEADRKTLGDQLNTLASQMNYLANDASYQGLNLINATASNIKVQFSEKTANVLQVDGANVTVSGGLVMTAFTLGASVIATSAGISRIAGVSMFAGFSSVSSSVSVFDAYIAMFESGITSVRTTAKTLGANVALLQTRLDFTKEYINTLKIGGDKLVLTDLNEEGANLVSLQTRQQLGIQALSGAAQAEQGVLSLFR